MALHFIRMRNIVYRIKLGYKIKIPVLLLDGDFVSERVSPCTVAILK